jgi:signal transduction histidine kinase
MWPNRHATEPFKNHASACAPALRRIHIAPACVAAAQPVQSPRDGDYSHNIFCIALARSQRTIDLLSRPVADMRRNLTKAKSTSSSTQAARTPPIAEFAASIAQEIKQPLTSVVLNAQASLRWLMQSDPDLDAARDAILTVANEGMRAGEMIGALLTLVRQSQPLSALCSINQVIDDVLALTREERQRQGVLLRLDLFIEDQLVFGTRTQLQQVMLNLVMNSIQAMSTVTDRPRVLTISLQLAEIASVLVAVEDTGPGLDPAIVDRIFDPLFTTKAGSLGIGLSVCRSIIEAYGGRIWASPRSVCGATFRFIVPVATDPELQEA